MKNNQKVFKYVFSFTFICIAFLMIFCDWFRDRIDTRIIALFIIAYVPWLTKYIKTFEGFGIKTELINEEKKQDIDKEMDKISNKSMNSKNKIDKDIKIDKSAPIGSEKNPLLIESMEVIARTSNKIEKMVLIRYEIEKELKILCRINNIQTCQNTIRNMIDNLRKNKILDNRVCNLLLDILPLLNKAVHSEIKNIDDKDIEWIIDKGSALVMHLEIISKDPSRYWMISFDD